MTTVSLYRPVGPKELNLIEASGWKSFPPRLPEQPIFYPVTNEEYAIQIARDWNVRASGSGYVTRFAIDEAYVARFPKKVVGDKTYEELWVPAEDIESNDTRAAVAACRRTLRNSASPSHGQAAHSRFVREQVSERVKKGQCAVSV